MSKTQSQESKNLLVLFDGDCALCNFFVRFLLRQDRNQILLFSSLQGALGTSFYKGEPENVVLVEAYKSKQPRIYTSSTAVIKILTSLGGLYRVFYILYIFPRLLRDWIYFRLANNRYSLFGKEAEHKILPENYRKQIIE